MTKNEFLAKHASANKLSRYYTKIVKAKFKNTLKFDNSVVLNFNSC